MDIDKIVNEYSFLAFQSEYKEDWDAVVYKINNKMFMMNTSYKDGRPIISLKLPPVDNISLIDFYQDKIIPGYYCNKQHWISIFLDTDINEQLIKDLIYQSYQCIIKTFSKKIQKELFNMEE